MILYWVILLVDENMNIKLCDFGFARKISLNEENKKENDEEMENIYNGVYKELSDFEKSVFDLKVMGLEYKEIASLLDKSYKSVDTALQRIRFKLKKLLNK